MKEEAERRLLMMLLVEVGARGCCVLWFLWLLRFGGPRVDDGKFGVWSVGGCCGGVLGGKIPLWRWFVFCMVRWCLLVVYQGNCLTMGGLKTMGIAGVLTTNSMKGLVLFLQLFVELTRMYTWLLMVFCRYVEQ